VSGADAVPVTLGDRVLRDRLVQLARSHGLDAVGVCDAAPFESARTALEERRAKGLHGGMAFTYRNPERSTDPARVVAGARSMLVGALRYDTTVAAPPGPGPVARVARYATEDHYAALRHALRSVAGALHAAGHKAVVVADDNAMVDRAAAVRAGIGWYGKSSNVLVPGQGSWFVLGSVVTDADLPGTGGPVDDGCGTCTKCLDGCPTGAIVAPGVVDARRCLAWLLQLEGDFPREFRAALGDRIYGCDECQEVCPPSRRADRLGPPGSASTDDDPAPAPGPADARRNAEPGAWVELAWLLEASDEELLGRLGRWYVPRREARYLRRNALVVLGNSAEPHDPTTERLLAAHLDGEDDLLAAHAAWAALRLGRIDLLEEPTRARRPAIAAEIAEIAGNAEIAAGHDVPRTGHLGEDGAP
jgi:epoxyqueuosine reductase